MNTFITILLYLITIIICYHINKYIYKSHLKRENDYNWTSVGGNLLGSILIFPSVIYWMLVILYNLPKFPEKPPKWL